MDFESKIISREVSEILWETEKTVSTAESCTGGRIAEAIIAVPGASKYFKGGIISYVDEVKQNLLGVDAQLLIELQSAEHRLCNFSDRFCWSFRWHKRHSCRYHLVGLWKA